MKNLRGQRCLTMMVRVFESLVVPSVVLMVGELVG
jgi:hypothetical protein